MTKKINGIPFEVKEKRDSWLLEAKAQSFKVQFEFSKRDFATLDDGIQRLKEKMKERR